MERKITTKKTALMFCFVLVGVVISGLIIMGAIEIASAKNAEVGYSVNEQGLTYNENVMPIEGDEPDLLQVVATNGKFGYVYYDEYEEACYAASSPEEADMLMAEHEEKATLALQDAINKYTPKSELDMTETDAKSLLSTYYEVCSETVDDVSSEKLIQEVSEEATLAIKITDENLELAFAEAEQAVMRFVTVYDADGVTVIGEFGIGCL